MAVGAHGHSGAMIAADEDDVPTPPSIDFQNRLNRVMQMSSGAGRGAGANATCQSEPSNEDQRFASRRKTKMKAVLHDPATNRSVTAIVQDISSTGVLIHLPVEMSTVSRAGDYVPARFVLSLPVERTEIDCIIAWRQGHRIGARFVSPSRMMAADPRARQVTRKPVTAKSSVVGRLFSR